ncbi:MAG: hypothetical protein ACTHJ4_00040 [Candidatus Nucleicultricaceae bacterium]
MSIQKYFLIGLSLLTVSSTSLNAVPSNPDVTFFLYDAGETKALEPILSLLKNQNKIVNVLAVGTAATLIKDQDILIDLEKDCGITTKITADNWKRDQKLNEAEVAKLKNCIKPSVLVAGYNSAVQTQLLEALKPANTTTVVFYDSFNPPAACTSPDKSECYALNAAEAADVLLVSTYELRDIFQKLSPQRCFAFGNPTLESWKKEIDQTDKNTLIDSLKINTSKPVILYVGGYGDDYESSFNLFLDAVKDLKNYEILVTIHPKANGQFEQKEIDARSLSHIKIMPKNIPTPSLASIATLVTTQRSTAGVQARFAGLPVIYLDVHPEKYTNFLIDANLVGHVSSPEAYIDELAIIKNQPRTDEEPLGKKLGIPQNAAEKITEYLISLIRETPSSKL